MILSSFKLPTGIAPLLHWGELKVGVVKISGSVVFFKQPEKALGTSTARIRKDTVLVRIIHLSDVFWLEFKLLIMKHKHLQPR